MRTASLSLLLCSLVSSSVGQTVPSDNTLSRIGLERLWVAQARVDPRSQKLTHLAVDERYVYGQSSDGSMTAFDAETGQRAWVVQLGPANRVTYAAVSNADVVVVVTGMTVFGVEKSSGHILWTAQMPASASTSAYVDEKYFYIGTSDGSVYAFDMSVVAYKSDTGRLPGDFDPITRSISSPISRVPARNIYMWRYRTGRSLSKPPVLVDDLVLLGDSKGQVYGITAGTPQDLGGKLTVQFQAGVGPTGGMVTRGGLAYVATGDGRVVAFDTAKGQVLWKFSFGHKILGSPILIDKTMFLTAESEGLLALDTETGNPVQTPNGPWRVGGTATFVTATKSLVYVSDTVGNLVAVDRKTAGPRGALPMVPFKVRYMNDLNDRVYLASRTGTITCLREIGSEQPKFYRNADRTPIDPLMADDAEAAGEENTSGENADRMDDDNQ